MFSSKKIKSINPIQALNEGVPLRGRQMLKRPVSYQKREDPEPLDFLRSLLDIVQEEVASVSEMSMSDGGELQETLDKALAELPADVVQPLEEFLGQVNAFAARGKWLLRQSVELGEALRGRSREKLLADSLHKIGDQVRTPRGEGIVRDVVLADSTIPLAHPHYVVDGGLYRPNEVEAIPAIDQLGRLTDE